MKRFILFFFILFSVSLWGGELSLQKTEAGYNVLIDGKLFAGYVTDFQGTPIVYPLVGPAGKEMTRNYPMKIRDDNTEEKDHPHHRSLWFTHGNVNGLDFWTADKKTQKTKYQIKHRQFLKTDVINNTAILETANDWLGTNDEPVCSDIRTLCFGVLDKEKRYIDFAVTVKAEQESVVFGDTKEGTFAVRVAGTMKVTAAKRNPQWGGKIVNAEGLTDSDAWGKRSAWVDYSGHVGGETVGITIINDPASFRYPTYWHVRDYGLFAANPFGVHDFEGKADVHSGDLKLKRNETFTLKYRVILH